MPATKKSNQKQALKIHHIPGKAKHFAKITFWFFMGAFLGLFLLISFSYIIFQQIFRNEIYPGVFIQGMNVGGKTPEFVDTFFSERNKNLNKTTFTFIYQDQIATISAQQLHLGYDSKLLAEQAFSIGRSHDAVSNASIVLEGYLTGLTLSPAYTFSQEALASELSPIIQKIKVDPVDAVFAFQNGKVTTFRPSTDGQEVDMKRLTDAVISKIPFILATDSPQTFTMYLPIHQLKPHITTDQANNLGIKELIGTGTSLFQHSIPGRIYNVTLAASRVNGTLVAPGEEFSFAKAVGDVSSFTGYQQAYVIQDGKTVLGDGGGVCQVSTTLFRAALNAGLPITERHAHAYRVGYYEEDGPPGIDATVYVPSIDLKFRNDTGHYILIQEAIDPSELRLTFYIYGVSDGRTTSMTNPVVSNIVPALPTIYTDDPTLPPGTLKQVDFAANGATVSFSRTVMKDGKVYISDFYKSVYQPWAAAYVRGPQ
ncbi:MAG TPA: VanW family protein [Patescibacteria group bacterium]|nr:VanW family protein [Patescibacteria group bacterium]